LSNIRVHFSGFVAFIAGITSVIFGLVFTLTITRRLLPEEYGIWGLLLSIVNYLLISEVIFSYWSTRQIARNENIGKSSVLSSLLFSLCVIPIFIAYIFAISETSKAQFDILFLGILLVPVSFVSQTLSSINMGHKPHVVSYSQIVFQIIKIPIALLTVVLFDLSVFGVVIAVLLAFLGKISLQIFYARNKLKEKFDFQKFKWWIKFSWIPLFGHVPNFFQTIDIAIYSVITGSVIGIAYYNAAYAISVIVSHAGSISQALYPKLLANKSFEGISKNISNITYFGILLVCLSMIFSKPALFALNPLYQNAWPIVIILSVKLFLQALRTIPTYVIFGTEQIDLDHNLKFSKLIKSNLFRIPKFLAFFNFGYILSLIIFLQLSSPNLSDLDLVFWWSIFGVTFEIPISLFLWIYSKKYATYSFSFKTLTKYLIGAFAMVSFFVTTSNFILNYEPSIYIFLPSLLLELFLCVSVYIGLTYLIDKEVRILFSAIFGEIKNFKP